MPLLRVSRRTHNGRHNNNTMRWWFAVMMFLFMSNSCCSASSSSGGGKRLGPAGRSKTAERISSSSTNTASSSSSSILRPTEDMIQIYETEHYNETTHSWKAASKQGRWTNALDGSSTQAPTSIEPPSGYTFTDNWKIAISDKRDAIGWEYIYHSSPNQPATRRRIWLRTLEPISIIQEEEEEPERSAAVSTTKQQQQQQRPRRKQQVPSTTSSLVSLLLLRRQRQRLASLWQDVRDDWNFKGFGWSFYKSFLFRESCGALFRIPITYNFDWWERHPELPSLSSSFGLYYPWMIGTWISLSVNVEWIKWKVTVIVAYVMRAVTMALLMLYTLVGTPLSLFFPIIKLSMDKCWKSLPHKIPLQQKPHFESHNVQERIGMSLSWRYSQQRGYEFRISQWHIYLPTMVYLYSIVQTMWQKTVVAILVQNNEKRKRPSMSSHLQGPILDWLRLRTGSLGLSTARPIPDPPHFSCSGVLSLSGFTFQRRKQDITEQQPDLMVESEEEESEREEESEEELLDDLLRRQVQSDEESASSESRRVAG